MRQFIMASASEEDLNCPICQEVFKEPVLLSCSHSFCKDCLRSWWRQKPTQECPVCKRRSSKSDPPLNRALRNLCDQQREQKTSEEQLCPVHSEKLKLFCVTDLQPVCVVCRDSKVHEGHCFKPIIEAAPDLRDELDKSLQPLKENLQKVKNLKEMFEKQTAHIKDQSHRAQRQIQDEFKKRHQFLVEEEESRIKPLREEEEQKTQRMKDKMAPVNRVFEALSETIRATEEQLKASHVSFLLKYKAGVERVQRCPLLEDPPQLGSRALIDLARHLGDMTFNIWNDMKRQVQYSAAVLVKIIIVLAFAALIKDVINFTLKKKETHQDLKKEVKVFGSEGFDSGSHSWDVEVGDSDVWHIGVSNRASEMKNSEWWFIALVKDKYVAAVRHKSDVPLTLKSHSNQRIRVCFDCDKHVLRLYDADSKAHIHTFSQISHKTLFPYVYTGRIERTETLPQKSEFSGLCYKSEEPRSWWKW